MMKSENNILVLYGAFSTSTVTVHEYLDSFRRFSRHNYFYADAIGDAHCTFDFKPFDAVFVHYSVRLSTADYFSSSYARALENYRGLKVLFIQDEYENTERARRWMDRLGFDIVFTCVPEASWPSVYPTSRFPRTTFIQVLTGYVSDDFLRVPSRALEERRIWVGYRGRRLSPVYGDLGQEKLQIGIRFKELALRRGMPVDIEWSGDKRIYGDEWLDFIGSCRAMLGTESGSNIFDLDGTLNEQIQHELTKNPEAPYEHFQAKFLRGHEGSITRMNQISPKIFEAIALRTGLVLFKGEYSGILRPDRHYISLEKDFSNFDEVADKLGDLEFLRRMTQAAYDDVVASGRYSYREFIRLVDETVSNLLPANTPRPRFVSFVNLNLEKSSSGRRTFGKQFWLSPSNVPLQKKDLLYARRMALTFIGLPRSTTGALPFLFGRTILQAYRALPQSLKDRMHPMASRIKRFLMQLG